MSPYKKNTKANSEASPELSKNQRRPRLDRSTRAGLTLPVGRVHRFLKEGRYAQRVSFKAAIQLTAALEYLAAEILELAANAAVAKKCKRIVPRLILFAIKNDKELDKLLGDVIISGAGVMPHIEQALLLRKT